MRHYLTFIILCISQLSYSQKLDDSLYLSIIHSIFDRETKIVLQSESIQFPRYMNECILEYSSDISEKTKIDSNKIQKIIQENIAPIVPTIRLTEKPLPGIIQFKSKKLEKQEKYNSKVGRRIWEKQNSNDTTNDVILLDLYKAKIKWIIRLSKPVIISNDYFIIFAIFGDQEPTFVHAFFLFKINHKCAEKIATYCWTQR